MKIIVKNPGWLILAAITVAGATFIAQADVAIEAGKFSAAEAGDLTPSGWEPLYFKKISAHTVYSLVKTQDATVVKAVSNAAASGLTRAISINPKQHPIIEWRWKVDSVIKKSDATRKSGDDYAARIYITFAYEPDKVSLGRKIKYKTATALFGDAPIGAVSYIWENKLALDTLLSNPYTDFVKMIVVANAATPVGEWRTERRNIYEDYRRAFGAEPPMISGIAIMTDTDNTGESATAYYGDIVFKGPAQ